MKFVWFCVIVPMIYLIIPYKIYCAYFFLSLRERTDESGKREAERG